jgi:tetratricopeptide (TPR) repeat protein
MNGVINMRKITEILLLWAILGGLCGCNHKPLTPEAKILLEGGIAAYHNDDHESAIRQMDAFLVENSRTKRADEAYYYRGLAHYDLNHVDAARRDFQRALDRTDREDMRGRVLIALGDLAYEEVNLTEAEHMFLEALDKLPRGEQPRDHALYRLGTVLQREGRWQQADRYLNQLIGDFDDNNKLVQLAKRRVHGRYWTVQVGAFEKQDGAEQLAEQLQVNNLPVFTPPGMVDGKLLFFVQVGRYSTYGQASQMAGRLKPDYEGAFVTVTRTDE